MSLDAYNSPNPLMLAEQRLWLGETPYRLVREIGRGKSAISYL